MQITPENQGGWLVSILLWRLTEPNWNRSFDHASKDGYFFAENSQNNA